MDGTEVLVAGDRTQCAGLPIHAQITVRGQSVTVDAQGIAAASPDGKGKLEALAAGGPKSLNGGGISIELAERADVALWRDDAGKWHGVLQGWDGPVPPPLQALTVDWQRLAIPLPLGGTADEH